MDFSDNFYFRYIIVLIVQLLALQFIQWSCLSFSYTYDLTHTLQYNHSEITIKESPSLAPHNEGNSCLCDIRHLISLTLATIAFR